MTTTEIRENTRRQAAVEPIDVVRAEVAHHERAQGAALLYVRATEGTDDHRAALAEARRVTAALEGWRIELRERTAAEEAAAVDAMDALEVHAAYRAELAL